MLVVTLRLSPWHSSCLFRPSKDTQAVFLLSGDTEIFSSTPAGTTIGLQIHVRGGGNQSRETGSSNEYLNDKECGQMGVTITAGTLGWIMLAPAATA